MVAFFTLVLQALWLLGPAGFANVTPPFFAKLFPSWSWPMDFGIRFKGERLFGENKTIRGLIAAIVFGEIYFLLFVNFLAFPQVNHLIFLLPWYYGALVGLAAMLGDAIKSFFKRQRHISEGNAWIPFDQLDWVFGYIAVLTFYIPLNWSFLLVSLLLGFVLHLMVKSIGFFIGINKQII